MKKRTKVSPSVPVLAAVFVLLLMFAAIPVTPADSPVFIPFNIPGAPETRGHDINPAGQVVGQYLGTDGFWHGFLLPKGVFGLLSDGVFETIDVDGATMTRPRGINPSGQIVGEYEAGGKTYGFLLSSGNLTVLDVPGATGTNAFKINPNGVVAGYYIMSGTYHGFLWTQYTGFTTIDYPGAANTQARGINADGDIVGFYWGPGTNSVFVRSHDGIYTTKDVSAAIDSPTGNAINSGGQIVGDGRRPASSFPPPNGRFGFLLTERGVSYFQVVPAPGSTYTYPFGISANGWIVGFYQDYTSSTGDGGKRHGFLVHRSSLE